MASLSSLHEKWANYRIHFPEQVEAFEKQNGDVVEKSKRVADEEDAADFMEDSLTKLRQGLGAANRVKELGGLAVVAAHFLQGFSSRFNLELEGPKTNLAEQVAANQTAFSNIFTELACKYGTTYFAEPEVGLLIHTASCAGSVHSRNSLARKMEEAEKGTTPGALLIPPPERLPEPQQRPERTDNVAPPALMGAAQQDGE